MNKKLKFKIRLYGFYYLIFSICLLLVLLWAGLHIKPQTGLLGLKSKFTPIIGSIAFLFAIFCFIISLIQVIFGKPSASSFWSDKLFKTIVALEREESKRKNGENGKDS
jgi:hypothetical protein